MDEKKDFLGNEEHEHDHECGCGHDHDHEEDAVLYLSFEEGEEVACTILGIFEVEDKEYMALLPEDDEGILLYEYIEEEETFDLIPIENEDELNTVYDAYVALFEEEFEEFDDEEDYEED